MKKISIFIIFAFILSSCAPAITAPTETAIPSSTITSTATPTNTPIPPSPTLEPGSFVFDIATGVPGKDEAEIKLGIDLARAYMRDYLGGDVLLAFQKEIKIIIVATGLGDPTPAGNGSCCTYDGGRIFYDVKHSNWNIGSSPYWSNTDHHMNSGAHEYVHAWQGSLGCLKTRYQPLGDWLNEGIAEYVSINTLKHNGYVTESDYLELISVALNNTKAENLAAFEHNSPHWAGDIGFVAVTRLVSLAPAGELSLRQLCENIATGKSVDQSFTEAFGISKNDFYRVFGEYQKTYVTPTTIPITTLTPTAIPEGMVVVKGKAILAEPNQKFSDYVVSFCNSKIIQCLPGNFISDDGTFITYLDPGEYKISVNPLNGDSALGWYAEKGLLPDPICATLLQIGGEEINIIIDFHPTSCDTSTVTQVPGTIRIRGNAITPDTSIIMSKYIITPCKLKIDINFINIDKCLSGASINPSGSFFLDLLPGSYYFSINSTMDGQAIGWYSTDGLVSVPVCATIIKTSDVQNISITINPQKITSC